MTYCLALKLDEGLVFASDTRTNAGVDYATAYRKMHLFDQHEDRLLVLLAAGNLAITTELVDDLRRDLLHQPQNSLAGCQHMFDAARSNLTVGLPCVAIYAAGQFRLAQLRRVEEGSSFHARFSDAWQQSLEQAFASLPRFDWERDGNP